MNSRFNGRKFIQVAPQKTLHVSPQLLYPVVARRVRMEKQKPRLSPGEPAQCLPAVETRVVQNDCVPFAPGHRLQRPVLEPVLEERRVGRVPVVLHAKMQRGVRPNSRCGCSRIPLSSTQTRFPWGIFFTRAASRSRSSAEASEYASCFFLVIPRVFSIACADWGEQPNISISSPINMSGLSFTACRSFSLSILRLRTCLGALPE